MTTFMTYKEERDALRQQLAEKDAEIEHLDRTKAEWKNTAKLLDEQLAASQAREQQLREALQDTRTADDISYCASGDYFTDVIDAAIALPQDTTALEAMIAEAGEVMRERCADACISFGESTDLVFGEEFAEEIRALPGVTLEDLK